MDFLSYLIIGLVIWFIFFLILRELNCWYFKINEIVSLLKSIDKKLGNNETNNESDETVVKENPNREEPEKDKSDKDEPVNNKWLCSGCGAENVIYCPKCGKPIDDKSRKNDKWYCSSCGAEKELFCCRCGRKRNLS